MIMQKLADALNEVFDWPLRMVVTHFQKRKFELAMTLIMLGEALLLFFSPGSIEASAFRFITDTLSSQAILVIFTVLGVSRIIALALNGNWMPWGAYVRAFGAFCGALMWAQMDAALFTLPTNTGSPLSPGIPVYTVLAMFELISMYEALLGIVERNGKDR